MRPACAGDAGALFQAAEPHYFRHMTAPHPWNEDGFKVFLQKLIDAPDVVPFVIVRRDSGQVVGLTSYLDIRENHKGLEIGYTWISTPERGGVTNPEMKFLLLRHAFERLGAIRVQLKTDQRNLHSQAAISKLGAQREGVLRHHMIMPDGHLRDTVVYSIVASEWPEVRHRLIHRLGYEP